MNISQNKKEQQKQKSVQQPSAVESDGKSDSGSENDSNASPAANDGKAHVEFTEEEIIAPETNTVQYKVITISNLSINASIPGIQMWKTHWNFFLIATMDFITFKAL